MARSGLRHVDLAGAAYLDAVTRVLQRARREDPAGGSWEAADLQWWWRVDQHPNAEGARVWLRGDEPVLAVIATRWGDEVGLDLLGTTEDLAEHAATMWARGSEVLGGWPAGSALLRDDDAIGIAAALELGLLPGERPYVTAWLDAADRPTIPALADGYRLGSYAGGPHPMARRNGEHVAERLADCSLYRRDLDLAVLAPDGSVAAYALFWADPVTGVGLVEPMRVEDAHQGRGLGTALLASGLDGLGRAGCRRLKVTFAPDNEPAARLYTSAGFVAVHTSRAYARA